MSRQAFRNGRWKLDDFAGVLELVLDWKTCTGVVDPELRTTAMICRKVREAKGRAALMTLNDVARSYSA